jgi:hypothetical protein
MHIVLPVCQVRLDIHSDGPLVLTDTRKPTLRQPKYVDAGSTEHDS